MGGMGQCQAGQGAGHTRGMWGVQRGMMCPGSFISCSDRNCRGLGPTTRCAKSTMLRKLGTTEATVPKLLAMLCITGWV